jgi:hypothetical protein
MHLTTPLNNSPVQVFVRDAAQLRADGLDAAEGAPLIATVVAAYGELSDALKPLTIDTLRQHAAFANDPAERIDAERALHWLVGA